MIRKDAPTRWQKNMVRYLWSEVRSSPIGFTDMEFICRDGSVKAHRAFLGASCPILKNYLMVPDDQEEVTKIVYPDVKISTLNTFLKILYTGSATFSCQAELVEVNKIGMDLLGSDVTGFWNVTVSKGSLTEAERGSLDPIDSLLREPTGNSLQSLTRCHLSETVLIPQEVDKAQDSKRTLSLASQIPTPGVQTTASARKTSKMLPEKQLDTKFLKEANNNNSSNIKNWTNKAEKVVADNDEIEDSARTFSLPRSFLSETRSEARSLEIGIKEVAGKSRSISTRRSRVSQLEDVVTRISKIRSRTEATENPPKRLKTDLEVLEVTPAPSNRRVKSSKSNSDQLQLLKGIEDQPVAKGTLLSEVKQVAVTSKIRNPNIGSILKKRSLEPDLAIPDENARGRSLSMIPNESFSDRSILNDVKASVLGEDKSSWNESNISTVTLSSDDEDDDDEEELPKDVASTPSRDKASDLDSTGVFKRPLLATPIAVKCLFCNKNFGSYHVLRVHVNRKHKKLPTSSHGSSSSATSARTSSSASRRSSRETDPSTDRNDVPAMPLGDSTDRASSVTHRRLPTIKSNPSEIPMIYLEENEHQLISPTSHQISPQKSLESSQGPLKTPLKMATQVQIKNAGVEVPKKHSHEIESDAKATSDSDKSLVDESMSDQPSSRGATTISQVTVTPDVESSSARKRRGRKPFPRDENGKIIRSTPILIKIQGKVASKLGKRGRKRKSKSKSSPGAGAVSDNVTPQEESRYSCDECDVLFKTRYYLQKHRDASHKPVQRPETEPKKRIVHRGRWRRSGQQVFVKKLHWKQRAALLKRQKAQEVGAKLSDLHRDLPIAFVVLERIPFEQCQICFQIVTKPEKLSEHTKKLHS